MSAVYFIAEKGPGGINGDTFLCQACNERLGTYDPGDDDVEVWETENDVTTEEDIIAELARLSAPLKVHREHERCCDICERGTAHYVGDDETQLLHVVDDWGNESWMHPRDYAKLRNM